MYKKNNQTPTVLFVEQKCQIQFVVTFAAKSKVKILKFFLESAQNLIYKSYQERNSSSVSRSWSLLRQRCIISLAIDFGSFRKWLKSSDLSPSSYCWFLSARAFNSLAISLQLIVFESSVLQRLNAYRQKTKIIENIALFANWPI